MDAIDESIALAAIQNGESVTSNEVRSRSGTAAAGKILSR
jgi:hypothetical protein